MSQKVPTGDMLLVADLQCGPAAVLSQSLSQDHDLNASLSLLGEFAKDERSVRWKVHAHFILDNFRQDFQAKSA